MLGRHKHVIKCLGHLHIFKHAKVIIEGKVHGDIDPAGTGHAIGTPRAIDLQEASIGLSDFPDGLDLLR